MTLKQNPIYNKYIDYNECIVYSNGRLEIELMLDLFARHAINPALH